MQFDFIVYKTLDSTDLSGNGQKGSIHAVFADSQGERLYARVSRLPEKEW